jgi:ABC-type nitrate/sulfonate/bicarbonate transport system substrate-binding protein
MTPRSWFGLVALGIMAVLVACAPAPAAPSAQKELKKVRFGWTKQLSDSPLYRLPQLARAQGYEIEWKEQRLYPDLLKALALGETDITTVGYPQAAMMAEQKLANVKYIAGFVTGGTALVMHKDAKVTTWKDVEGKSIGIFAGGPGELNFRIAVATQGLDMNKVNAVKMTVPGAPLFQAVQKREIDGYMGWEPFASMSVNDGYAYRAPFDVQANDTKGVNAAIAANTDWLAKNGDVAVALLKLINEEMIRLKANEEDWAKLAEETIGMQRPVFMDAIRNFSLDTDLPFKLKESQAQAKAMAQHGMAQGDYSAEIPKYVDYTFLEKATGKTRVQLGGGT